MHLSGFVLAGGNSTRMGRDKALLNWHGHTLLDHMVELLRTVADPVHVVGRHPLPDRLPGRGPLSGIATGLQATSSDANLFVAVDLPLLTQDFLKYMQSRIEHSSHPLLVCKIGSEFPLCIGIWRPILPEVQRRLASKNLSVRAMLEAEYTEVISEHELTELDFDLSMFQNINTEHDYQSALNARISRNRS